MLKALKIEPELCTGCLQCELAYSYENEGVFNPAKSRIKVFAFHEQGCFAPYTCTQCAEAWLLARLPGGGDCLQSLDRL
jgi:anaerobic carbon-monoxide dehydrogenase iron sulfur subunit